ncbi:hypothetical protein [Synechocystis sp. PCC 7509]|nr:hypothetical protein [Synechocystis sp. PCC 7509]
MRYSIMLQSVVTITLIFLSSAAMFAWLQCRPGTEGIVMNKVSFRSNY